MLFLGNTICIRNFHVTLLDYQGINDMADVTVKSLIGSVKNAYIGFLQPILGSFVAFQIKKRFAFFIWQFTLWLEC